MLTPEKFNYLAEEHKRIAFVLVSQLAKTLAVRLRHTDDELTLMQENCCWRSLLHWLIAPSAEKMRW